MLQPLPDPTPEARVHSEAMLAHIRAAIAAAGGFIPFDRYMDLALYAPGLGYYTAGAHKFGAAGDFVTAPGLTPLFGQTLASAIAPVLEETGGTILELGAGEGRLAVDILRALPHDYQILEVSADLRDRQYQYIQSCAPAHLHRVSWLDHLPEQIHGVVLANEVLDALPVSLLHWRDGAIFERGVCLQGDALGWDERPLASGPLLEAARALSVAEGTLSEVGLAAHALVTSLSERLAHGAMFFIDYGFPRSEYYHPERREGTLMCHYRHLAHADPLHFPGLTDITAHVDFSAVAQAAQAAGCTLLGYTSQAAFLLNAGILDHLSALTPGSADYLRAASSVQRLLQPSEMGELFKVIALGRGVSSSAFNLGDRRHAL